MTTEEFSNEFDTLLDSYKRFKDFDASEAFDSIEFNEYEKSLFLTQAQEEVVREIYSGKYTPSSFERNEEARRLLDSLVLTKQYTAEDASEDTDVLSGASHTHTVFTLPSDCWYIIYEQTSWGEDAGSCYSGKTADVYPVLHDEFWRVSNNPFRGPNKRRVLRLDKSDKRVELVSDASIGSYTVRYLSKPSPIILTTFPDGLSIDGASTPQTCKLSDLLHRVILEHAVKLAINSIAASNLTSKSNDK